MCPASGNTIIATSFSTEVVDLSAPVCPGDAPNRLLGTLAATQNLPAPAEAALQDLGQRLREMDLTP